MPRTTDIALRRRLRLRLRKRVKSPNFTQWTGNCPNSICIGSSNWAMIRLSPLIRRWPAGFGQSQWKCHRRAIPYRLYATTQPTSNGPPPSQPGDPGSPAVPPDHPADITTHHPDIAISGNSTTQESSAHPKSQEPRRTVRLRPLIYAATFLLIGLASGQLFVHVVFPPPPPAPGTEADDFLVSRLKATLDKLPIVTELRSHREQWREWPAYSSIAQPDRPHRLTSGPMSGSAGISVQQVFWNEAENRGIIVLHFGSAVCGWPGVVHGGALATVLDESLGRVAIRGFPAKTGVTANLDLNYRRPVLANQWYVIRVQPIREGATDRKMWVSGTLEDLQERVCVEAKGLFVVPKGFSPRQILADF